MPQQEVPRGEAPGPVRKRWGGGPWQRPFLWLLQEGTGKAVEQAQEWLV